MAVAILTLLCLIQSQSTEEKIRALIEKLESEEIAQREEASRELKRAGYGAIPLLRKAVPGSTGEKKVLLERLIWSLDALGRPATVTMEVKDGPLKEFAAAIERQTGIPVRLIGTAADIKGGWTAKETVVWKVVEEICRSRGNLMYRFIDDAIEIYPSPFRALPSVDAHGMRFFIDRFICDGLSHESGGDKHPGFIRQHVAVLVPRGSRVVWVGFKVEELTDDKGNNWVKKPEDPGAIGGPLVPVEPDGFQTRPTSRKFLYPFYIHQLNQPPPPAECSKIKRLSGKVVVVVAEGLQRIASISNPLSIPSTPAKADLPYLGIKQWRIAEGDLAFGFTAAWNGEAEGDLWYRLKPLLILNEQGGDWQVSPNWNSWSRLSPKEVDRRDSIASFKWPKGSIADSLEIVGPHPIAKYEIPFDFRDIPLR